MAPRRRPWSLAAVVSIGLAACQAPLERDTGSNFVDLEQRTHYPLDVRAAPAHVLIFVADDCPIASAYAPAIQRTIEEFAGTGIKFFLVHVDPHLTASQARDHARSFGYDRLPVPCPILRDSAHVLVQQTGVKVTPEVAVLTPDHLIAYRGRIDDAWSDLGKRRRAPTTHELADALADVLAQRPVRVPRQEAVGCDIPELPRQE